MENSAIQTVTRQRPFCLLPRPFRTTMPRPKKLSMHFATFYASPIPTLSRNFKNLPCCTNRTRPIRTRTRVTLCFALTAK
jgi:hypothetical protein